LESNLVSRPDYIKENDPRYIEFEMQRLSEMQR